METQLVFDNTSRQLGLCFKQIFRGDQGILGKVKGVLNTVTGHVDATFYGHVNSAFLRGTGGDFRQRASNSKRSRRSKQTTLEFARPEVGIGTSYVPGSDQLMYYLTAKQKAFAGPLRLKCKGGVHLNTRSQQGYATGALQLDYTKYRVTEMQDVRFAVGCRGWADQSSSHGAIKKSLEPYGMVRENNWSFTTDFKGRWSVLYDL